MNWKILKSEENHFGLYVFFVVVVVVVDGNIEYEEMELEFMISQLKATKYKNLIIIKNTDFKQLSKSKLHDVV